MLDLKDMKYYSQDIGKIIKSFVHEYRWEFTIKETKVCIQMFSYFISNTRRILYNNEELIDEHGGPNNTYNYEFTKEGHEYKIVQSENVTQLYIDGSTFNYNYTLEKNKKEFQENNNQVFTIKRKNQNLGIQPSNEIVFFKNDKLKAKPILDFNIKNEIITNIKKNNVNKFNFNTGEDISIKINKKSKNKSSNRFKRNKNYNKTTFNGSLIDSDEDNNLKTDRKNSNKFNLTKTNYFNFNNNNQNNEQNMNFLNMFNSPKTRNNNEKNNFNNYGF